MKGNTLWVLLALVAGSVSILLLTGGETTPRMAPEFTLENLHGEGVSLSSFGGSVVILDFWASWCKPCTKTLPELHALQQRHNDQGVVLLLISLDKSAERARRYLEENGYSTTDVLWESLDAAREVKALYGVIGIPHTFVIDREGYIRISGHPRDLSDEDLIELL